MKRWPRHRNNGVVFTKPQREPFPWPAALVVAAILVGGLVILGLLLVAPSLMTKGMP